MENSEPQPSALDRMNELYSWLTAWDKYVQKEDRVRDPDTTDTKPRKKVVLKKSVR